jgi:ArsR family transcriptional regulator, arsenate/arsenite/antimonite-responsive transcriptional repressor
MSLDLRRSAELLHVLAHPTRLAILDNLKDGPKCVSDINELLDISQPNLSQHLAVLRRERIIDFYEKGKQRCYYITLPSMVQELMLFLAGKYPVVIPAGDSVCCVTNDRTKAARK